MKQRILTIELADRVLNIGRARRAAATGHYQGEYLGFSSLEQMSRELTPLRWALVALLQRGGAMSLRELARRAERDVKRVHGDAARLLDLGIVERDDQGQLHVPYAEIHAEFVSRKAA